MLGQLEKNDAFETTLQRDLSPKQDLQRSDPNQTMSSYFTVKPKVDKPQAQRIYEVARTANKLSVLRTEDYLRQTQGQSLDMNKYFPAGSKGREVHIVRKVPQAIKTVDFSMGEELYSINKKQKKAHPLSLQMRKKVILAENAVNF